MARNIVKTDFGPPPVRKDPPAPLCGHVNFTTGECCNRFGSFGRGPPLRPVTEWRCGEHLWDDYWTEKA